MSFRLFVYYCALGGAWSGLVGWVLGRSFAAMLTSSANTEYLPYILRTSLLGMFLGLAVAFALSFLDAAFSVSLRQLGKVFVRVMAAVVIGVLGGLFGSFVGGSLYYWTTWGVFFILSWTIVGFLIGMSICFFELFLAFVSGQDFVGAIKKFIKCLIGGTVGGILGGIMASMLNLLAGVIFKERNVEELWTPTAYGFIAIGACIGLLVGLAQIILMEAWIKVEAGFRPGRQMILSKAKTSIGRGEGSDIALFGDSGVEKSHANIVLDNGRYFLEDLQTPGGSFVNDQKVAGLTPLKAGDAIRVGKSVLRFGERAKRND